MVGGDHVATDEEMLELKTIFELVDRDRCRTARGRDCSAISKVVYRF